MKKNQTSPVLARMFNVQSSNSSTPCPFRLCSGVCIFFLSGGFYIVSFSSLFSKNTTRVFFGFSIFIFFPSKHNNTLEKQNAKSRYDPLTGRKKIGAARWRCTGYDGEFIPDDSYSSSRQGALSIHKMIQSPIFRYPYPPAPAFFNSSDQHFRTYSQRRMHTLFATSSKHGERSRVVAKPNHPVCKPQWFFSSLVGFNRFINPPPILLVSIAEDRKNSKRPRGIFIGQNRHLHARSGVMLSGRACEKD